jgi:hypothetical protein
MSTEIQLNQGKKLTIPIFSPHESLWAAAEGGEGWAEKKLGRMRWVSSDIKTVLKSGG